MIEELSSLLAPRIQKNCVGLFDDGHFVSSAREAFVQVEKALRQKGKTGNRIYGVNLIENLFMGKQEIVLKVPLGDDLQQKAKNYFKSVFAYYRNYLAHDGELIDEKSALRILILASELLELIDSSSLSLSESGGVQGMIQIGSFRSENVLHNLLSAIDGYPLFDGVYDGLFETLAHQGFGDEALLHLLEFGLIYVENEDVDTREDELISDCEIMERIYLTELGEEVLNATRQELTTKDAR